MRANSTNIGNRMLRSQRYVVLLIFTMLITMLVVLSFSAHKYVDQNAISSSVNESYNTLVDWATSSSKKTLGESADAGRDYDESETTGFPFTLDDDADSEANKTDLSKEEDSSGKDTAKPAEGKQESSEEPTEAEALKITDKTAGLSD